MDLASTALVSVNCSGTGSANDASYAPRISADGRYVVFGSSASDLVPGEFSLSYPNIYRRDLVAGTTVLASMNKDFTGGGHGYSSDAQISTSGGVVVFQSGANDLIAGDANQNDDVFAWNSGVVAANVDLALDLAASANSIVECSLLTFTLTVTNFGTTNATGVMVTDSLPPAFAFVSTTTSQGTVANSSGTVTANIGALSPGAGARITITVSALAAGNFNNAAIATASQPEATPANNTDSVMVLVTPLALPTLSLIRSNAQLAISWPSSAPAAFALQTTTNLSPVIVWTPVTNSVSINGLQKTVVIPENTLEPQRFFRLRK